MDIVEKIGVGHYRDLKGLNCCPRELKDARHTCFLQN